MPKRKPNTKIEDGKVVFSKEILNYFENIRTNENSEWIDKYFEILSDPSNFNAKKYNVHHIKPCFTFKDENHKTRKETEKLANDVEENRIKLSVKNHIICHFYIWKIFENSESKIAFQKMCARQYVDNINENELKEIAVLREECAKENLTQAEIRKMIKKWSESEKGKESIAKSQAKYLKSEKGKQTRAKYAKSKRGRIVQRKSSAKRAKSEKGKAYIHMWCHSEKGKVSRAKSLKKRIESGKSKEYFRKWRKTERGKEISKKSQYKYRHKICHDPIKGDDCSLGALNRRKQKHKEIYINVIPLNCVIKESFI